MTVTRVLARPLLAGMFVYGGIDALRHPEAKVLAAEDVAAPIAEALGLPTDPVTLIRINGGVQVAGGLLLAAGKVPRVASLLLAASLVPTTYAGHRFWNEPDEAERARQRVQFLKNMSMLGGLMLAAVDTDGRPSMAWRARRMVRTALQATDAGHLAEAPLDAVASLAHDAVDFGRGGGPGAGVRNDPTVSESWSQQQAGPEARARRQQTDHDDRHPGWASDAADRQTGDPTGRPGRGRWHRHLGSPGRVDGLAGPSDG